MPRTSVEAVQALLGRDYRPPYDLRTPVDSACVIVDRVETCAARKGTPLSSKELEVIERWLAAHLYQVNDPPYQEKSTEQASGTYLGTAEDGFDSTRYGMMAQRLDWSGCLRNLDKLQRASGVWLGRRR